MENETVTLTARYKRLCFTTTEQDMGTMHGCKFYYDAPILGQSFETSRCGNKHLTVFSLSNRG